MPEDTAEQLPKLDNVCDNATPEDFKMKNKVYELLKYAGPQLEEFPRAKRELARKIDETMLEVLRLVVTLENKHYKKTTLGDLDNELDVLRHLVRLAADADYTRSKKPCLPIKKYEMMARYINEIGNMIGGYYKSLNGSPQSSGNNAKKK
ncbi:MAG: diversity-generating retroelement protein Avd [Phascolarctobacterium sp.]|nr:diversity-generating retroelement protein Avd [Candidatus Phascolarctobacterium caballi]